MTWCVVVLSINVSTAHNSVQRHCACAIVDRHDLKKRRMYIPRLCFVVLAMRAFWEAAGNYIVALSYFSLDARALAMCVMCWKSFVVVYVRGLGE